MNLIKSGRLLVCIFMVMAGQLFAVDTKTLIFRNGKAEINFEDHLHHEFYWWPNTLLSYPVVFEEKSAIDELILTDRKSGKQLPFQMTGLEKTSKGTTRAVLHLMTALPSGGNFNFELRKGSPEPFQKVKVEQKGSELVIQTNKLTVFLPTSKEGVTSTIPGPVVSISQNGKARMGNSLFQPGQKKLKRLDSKIVSQGPLFAEVEVNYQFVDGSIYRANIRCINNYDFVEIKESMQGFPKGGQTGWEMRWDNFAPTHRQAPNHPYGKEKDTPGFRRYDWETINQGMMNSHHGIAYAGADGKIPFEIGIYGNWPAERTVTSSVFWDEKAMQSVGAFMVDASLWDDKEYAVWSNSGKINVKFYYNNGKLKWTYPVYDGTRSTALSCYPHQNDVDYMEELERLSNPKKPYPRTKISQLSYNTFLQNRFSTIALDRLKDWDLTYPAPKALSPVIFPKEKGTTVATLERYFHLGGYTNELAISGPCQNSGYAPVPARSFYESYVVTFNTLLPEANATQREKLVAAFLLHAYMSAGEEYMPMRVMLSGHPNFLADVKGISALASFLFPEHPMAKTWSDMFEKYVDLNARYHVRPNVESWNSTGGRWTENLGTYTWAALRPTVRTNFLLQDHTDGKNRLANEQTKLLAASVLHCLSAPYNGEQLEYYRDATTGKLDGHSWGVVDLKDGPARIHPPQGAHALRRRPPSVYWRFGKALENYDPLLSENIRYITRPEHDDMEASDRAKEIYKIMYTEDKDPGTPPDFQSVKLTGYGIILRAAVGTKEELSVHLQQIDKGPNYRWGLAADGGCGTIYFYAAGKSYSHNGKEDIGDRRIQDTDLLTNFGVFKDGHFKAIGRNDLTRPLYDLSIGQFAEIVSSKKDGYSWPEYQGRSVMLVGSDYFMIYDDVYNGNMGTRFSWFTHPLEDLPELNVVKGGAAGYNASKGKPEMIKVAGRETKGLWFDGTGDCMTFVSHKKGFTQETTPYGCIVTAPGGSKDYIFRNDTPVQANLKGYVFEGTAGFIREQDLNKQEIALFHGTRIGNEDFEIQTKNPDAGISAIYSAGHSISGQSSGATPSPVTFQWKDAVAANMKFYLDGVKLSVRTEGNKLFTEIPAGKHIWTLTVGLPDLKRPEIAYTRNEQGKVFLAVHPVSGAEKYRFEYSTNGNSGWKTLKEQVPAGLLIKPEGNEGKGYVRVIAVNTDHQSIASVIYPVYFTSAKPHFPDGLKLAIEPGKVTVSWGKVLGCNEYQLLKRIKGAEKYQLVYKGKERQFIDKSLAPLAIYEYAVKAVNGNGAGESSLSVDTDPESWLNFDPKPGEKFRRVASLWGETDNSGSQVGIYYPE